MTCIKNRSLFLFLIAMFSLPKIGLAMDEEDRFATWREAKQAEKINSEKERKEKLDDQENISLTDYEFTVQKHRIFSRVMAVATQYALDFETTSQAWKIVDAMFPLSIVDKDGAILPTAKENEMKLAELTRAFEDLDVPLNNLEMGTKEERRGYLVEKMQKELHENSFVFRLIKMHEDKSVLCSRRNYYSSMHGAAFFGGGFRVYYRYCVDADGEIYQHNSFAASLNFGFAAVAAKYKNKKDLSDRWIKLKVAKPYHVKGNHSIGGHIGLLYGAARENYTLNEESDGESDDNEEFSDQHFWGAGLDFSSKTGLAVENRMLAKPKKWLSFVAMKSLEDHFRIRDVLVGKSGLDEI